MTHNLGRITRSAGADLLPNASTANPLVLLSWRMEDGLVKDELTTATTAATVRGTASRSTVAAVLRWWRKLTPTQRTIAIASLTGAAAVVLLAWYAADTAQQARQWKVIRECENYTPRNEWKLPDDDSFGFSMATSDWGRYYSYKQGSTGVTDGPRLLLLLDSWQFRSGHGYMSRQGYSMARTVQQDGQSAEYSLEMTIGQDANGNVVWSSSSDDHDGNVVIDPSVVHLGFSNGATYSIYNDTVFFISYDFTGNELHVEERPIDLSGVVWTNCSSVKDLFQRNTDVAAFVQF
jgi:hypothetical protein